MIFNIDEIIKNYEVIESLGGAVKKVLFPICNEDGVSEPSAFLDHLIEKELVRLGLENTLFSIVNPNRVSVKQKVVGFTEHQVSVYQALQEHDVYLQTYLKKNCTSRIVYLQSLVPNYQIKDALFNDILIPTIGFSHSYSGLYAMANGFMMVLSCHSERVLSYSQVLKLDEFWQVLCKWSDNWLTQQLLEKTWNSYQKQTVHPPPLDELSDTECQVYVLLLKGFNGSEIAALRNVSKETTRTQIKQILRKFGARHQNQLICDYYNNNPVLNW